MSVAADNTIDHYDNAASVCLLSQVSKRIAPASAALVRCEPQCLSHCCRSRDNIRSSNKRSDERDRILLVHPGIVAIPVLPLLALVDRVQQIGASVPDLGVTDRAKIGDRKRLLRRRRQEQIANRSVCRRRELLQLFEGWLLRAVFPMANAGSDERGRRQAGAIALAPTSAWRAEQEPGASSFTTARPPAAHPRTARSRKSHPSHWFDHMRRSSR